MCYIIIVYHTWCTLALLSLKNKKHHAHLQSKKYWSYNLPPNLSSEINLWYVIFECSAGMSYYISISQQWSLLNGRSMRPTAQCIFMCNGTAIIISFWGGGFVRPWRHKLNSYSIYSISLSFNLRHLGLMYEKTSSHSAKKY